MFLGLGEPGNIFYHEEVRSNTANQLNKHLCKLAMFPFRPSVFAADAEVCARRPTDDAEDSRLGFSKPLFQYFVGPQVCDAFAVRYCRISRVLPTDLRHALIPCLCISANAGSISLVQTISKPACSNPMSRKPPPVKNDNSGTGITTPAVL